MKKKTEKKRSTKKATTRAGVRTEARTAPTPLAASLETIKKWMRDHGAEGIADSLARPARGAMKMLPTELRALYQLHDGQRSIEAGYFFPGGFQFLSSRESRDTTYHKSYLDMMRDELEPRIVKRTRIRLDELRSDDWHVFAARDSDVLAVSGVSGRVFVGTRGNVPDELPGTRVPYSLTLIAESLSDLMDGYTRRLARGFYREEDGCIIQAEVPALDEATLRRISERLGENAIEQPGGA